MKKLKKFLIILLIILVIIAVLIFGGRYALIKILSNNQQVNDIVDRAADIVSDEKVQKEIDNFVQEMINEGTLKEEDIVGYNQYVQNVQGVQNAQETVAEATLSPTTPPATKEPEKAKGKSRTERILSAMSPSDAAFARSMYGKINLGYAMDLMNTDPVAGKAYIKSCLSPGEISTALSIYSKYAYLLSEIK